jgi:hypothetical protein
MRVLTWIVSGIYMFTSNVIFRSVEGLFIDAQLLFQSQRGELIYLQEFFLNFSYTMPRVNSNLVRVKHSINDAVPSIQLDNYDGGLRSSCCLFAAL